jgi:hypothetical protein
MRQRYRRKPDQVVTAVQLLLPLEGDGFSYRKWGDVQRAKTGGWLVDNDGDVYTVAACSFAGTYRQTAPGRWLKTTPVWAEQATQAGDVATKEGLTHYEAGDWLVSNNDDGSDAYAIGADKFDRMYDLDTAAAPAPPGQDR